jgi:hypothetical protein
VDLYAAEQAMQQTLYRSRLLPMGYHVLVVEVSGDRNPLATGNLVSVDGFTVRECEGFGDDPS